MQRLLTLPLKNVDFVHTMSGTILSDEHSPEKGQIPANKFNNAYAHGRYQQEIFNVSL